MTWWCEVRAGKARNGKIRLVPLEEVYNYRGFRSVFAYDDATSDLIRSNNSTKGLRGHEVYCDTLFMDFDDHDPVEFRQWLQTANLSATEWHSGGRSFHFHIDVSPVFGVWVPGACKTWVKLSALYADVSFYSTSGLYRLPGTFHNKYPGQFKHLLNAYPGQKLTLTAPALTDTLYPTVTTSDDTDFWVMLQYGKPPGQRTMYIWTMATVASESGITYADCLRNILFWNSTQAQPHSTDYVTRKVSEAYQRTANEQR